MRMRLIEIFLILVMSQSVYASDDQERIYLTQVLNQLHAIKPLIVAAAREQPTCNRVKFHYTRFRRPDGKVSNGIIDDINEIENGIKEKLYQSSISPHTFKPIKGDYVESSNGEKKA